MPITIVVHSTAAATDAYDVMVPVQRFPNLRGIFNRSVGAASAAVDKSASGKASLENTILVGISQYADFGEEKMVRRKDS